MEIKPLEFENRKIQINETYVDESGRIKERTKEIIVPIGRPFTSKNENQEPGQKPSE